MAVQPQVHHHRYDTVIVGAGGAGMRAGPFSGAEGRSSAAGWRPRLPGRGRT